MEQLFELMMEDKSSKARTGRLKTAHGEILTPIFMPVGTAGTVKAVTNAQLKEEIGAQIILGNTYHLYLRPGSETLEKSGGLHRFMDWDRPILTDSGGYQVFSLSGTRKISNEGVSFQSHIDGSTHLFTPEKVIDIQRSIGADIIMCFDECPAHDGGFDYVKGSMKLTHEWLLRCIQQFERSKEKYGFSQYLFPIVQGGVFEELREESCDFISSVDAPGNAIGGLSVGEPEDQLYSITALCCELLPKEKPRYLMGVGTPWNILETITLGIDMFDCVMPTRNGRNAMLFTSEGVINIDNKKWEHDFSSIDAGIDSELSNHYSKAYLRHLMKTKEILGLTIASVHNLAFYLHLVREARMHIEKGDFLSWKNEQVLKLQQRL